MKLVFLHGSGSMGEAWHYQSQHFRDKADAVTLPGHPRGKSIPTVEGYTEWLRGYIWGKGYQDVVLVGHSLGGAITLCYAVSYPEELKAIVLVGSGARLRVHPQFITELENGIKDKATWAKGIEPRYALVDPKVAKWVIEKRIEVGPAVQLNDMLACDKFDVMERVSQIKLPTIAIVGTDDVMTPVKYSQFLVSKIAGAKLVIIQGATHSVPLEKPAEVNKAIEEFTKGI